MGIDNTRMCNFIAARSLEGKWSLMSDAERGYATHLCVTFHTPVDLAIQQAYLFGFNEFNYDYSTHRSVRDTMRASDFGL